MASDKIVIKTDLRPPSSKSLQVRSEEENDED